MQKLKKDKEAAQRSLQMQMQPESGTVKDQLESELMQATKQEIASSLAPGLQQQGQMMQAQQMQKAMAGGLPTQPAPNMVNMARGGIVGYAPGGDVQKEKDFIQTFTTPSGERLTRDDLIMMRRADQIPQETMLTDSSGQRLTVSDAIMNPMSRSDEIDMTPEGAARRRAYERIGTERSRPLEESPEAMLARTMGTPGDRDVQSVRTMPEESSRPSRFIEALGGAPSAGGGTGRVTYTGPSILGFLSDPQSYRDMRENVAGVPVVGEALDKWLAKAGIGSSTTKDVEADPASAISDALLVYAGSGLLRAGGAGAGALFRMMANNPRFTAALTALGIKGGDELIDFARQNVPGVVSDEGENAEAGIASVAANGGAPTQDTAAAPTSTPVSGTGIASLSQRGAPSAEEAAMQATRYQATDKALRSMMGEDLSPMQRAASAEPFRSRYADRLAALEGEKTDKLGALIDFLQAAGASGGTNLGATLMGGGSGLQAREARLKAEEMGLLDLMTAEEQAQLDRDFRERELQQRGEISREEIASRSDVLEKEWAIRSNIEAAKDRNEALALGMQNITIHPAYLIAAEKYKEDNDRLFGGPSDAQLEVGADAAGRNAALPYIKSEIDAIFGPSATSSSMPADVAGIVDQYADK